MKKLSMLFLVVFAVCAAVVCILCLAGVLPDNLVLECAMIIVFGANGYSFLKVMKAKAASDIPMFVVILALTLAGVVPGIFVMQYRKTLPGTEA